MQRILGMMYTSYNTNCVIYDEMDELLFMDTEVCRKIHKQH